MLKITKPWGYEEIFAHTDKYVGKIIHIDEGHRLSYQYHVNKSESIYVLHGVLLVMYQDELKIYHEGESFDIPNNTNHRFIAYGDNPEAFGPVDLIEVSTPELDDVVRLEDDYGRN